MQRVAAIVLLLFLSMPLVSAAGEPTLYGVGMDVLALADAALQCAADDKACTEYDIEAITCVIRDDLRGLLLLTFSTDTRGLRLTKEQVQALDERMALLHARLARGVMLGRACNAGLALIANACTLWSLYVTYFIPSAGLSTIYLLGAIISVGLGSLLQLACLFWWL